MCVLSVIALSALSGEQDALSFAAGPLTAQLLPCRALHTAVALTVA